MSRRVITEESTADNSRSGMSEESSVETANIVIGVLDEFAHIRVGSSRRMAHADGIDPKGRRKA